MITPREVELSKQGDAKAGEGSFAEAINLYEAALDGTPASADVHYKLGLIYDDKLNDPLNALHHFKRFLALQPSGKRAEEVKRFAKRDELALSTSLAGDSMVPRSELARLTNENLNLRQQLGERWAAEKLARAAQKNSPKPKSSPNEHEENNSGPRNYTVQPGDTLASIARKFYKSSSPLAADHGSKLQNNLEARRSQTRTNVSDSIAGKKERRLAVALFEPPGFESLAVAPHPLQPSPASPFGLRCGLGETAVRRKALRVAWSRVIAAFKSFRPNPRGDCAKRRRDFRAGITIDFVYLFQVL